MAKLPKKPTLKKYPKQPKRPKGGIKTPKQVEAWEQKVKSYCDKCKDIDKGNDAKMKVYNGKISEINKLKTSVVTEKNKLKSRIEKANSLMCKTKKR